MNYIGPTLPPMQPFQFPTGTTANTGATGPQGILGYWITRIRNNLFSRYLNHTSALYRRLRFSFSFSFRMLQSHSRSNL
ncbi:exosporium leader peptide-containing protein [Bacillus wiedmannii]|uniref:exosporium leader peptide-containing protein n=1 Tax=Bacillus wiedmannii TaxID=1890302 RepID=UPI003CF47C0A